MRKSKNEITRFRGDTYSVEAVLKKTINKVEVPIDFTDGTTAKFSYKKGSGKKVTIDGLNGTADGEITFPFVETAQTSILPGQYIYDIQITSGSGEIQTYVKDIMNIVDDITR